MTLVVDSSTQFSLNYFTDQNMSLQLKLGLFLTYFYPRKIQNFWVIMWVPAVVSELLNSGYQMSKYQHFNWNNGIGLCYVASKCSVVWIGVFKDNSAYTH